MSKGLRQAALSLYGLAARDRKWVLKRVPTERRADLEAALKELKALGIPPQAVRGGGAESPPSPAPLQAEPVGIINRAQPKALVALFSAEPIELFELFVRIDAWPWERRVRRKLARRGFAPVVRPSTRVPAALREALVAAVAARLQDLQEGANGTRRVRRERE